MRRTTRQRVALGAAAPLLAVALVACGGDSATTADDSISPATDSSASASESASAEPTTGEEVDTDQFVDDLMAAMEKARSAHMTMEMDGPMKLSLASDVDYSSQPPAMDARMAMGQQKMQFRLVDDFVYMNMGELSGGKFFKANINDSKSPLGDLTQLKESMDPKSSFESFTEGLEKVTFRGQEKVDGDRADHYVLTLDTSKISALDQLNGTPGGATPQLPKELEYDVWLDSADRMRRVEIDLGKKLGTMLMTVSKWNEPVKIVAPPKAQVTQPPTQQPS